MAAEELELCLQEDSVVVEMVDQIQMIMEKPEKLILVVVAVVAVMLQAVHLGMAALAVQV